MKVDALLMAPPADIARRAEELAATGVDGLFTFEGPHDVFLPLAIAASTGSACHAGVHTASATLLALGIEPDLALGALRLTLGRSTTREQITQAAEAILDSWMRNG